LLAFAYRRALEVASDLGCRTIALPTISCGIYGYPPEHAAPLATEEARRAAGRFDEIRFVFLGEGVRDAFQAHAVSSV
jgi:O-acetyl-ADP-ribose deacetylase